MEQHIRALRDQMLPVIFDRGDNGLHRFLTELLGAMLGALVQQLAGVGRLPSRRRSGIYGGGKVMDRKTRHQLNSHACPEIGALIYLTFSTSVTKSRQGSSRIGNPARTM